MIGKIDTRRVFHRKLAFVRDSPKDLHRLQNTSGYIRIIEKEKGSNSIL
jgi:hypothetical protein